MAPAYSGDDLKLAASDEYPGLDKINGRLFITASLQCYDENDAGFFDVDATIEEGDLIIGVPLASLLEGVLSGNDFFDGSGIDMAIKPRIDEVRAILVALISKIDAITYTKET